MERLLPLDSVRFGLILIPAQKYFSTSFLMVFDSFVDVPIYMYGIVRYSYSCRLGSLDWIFDRLTLKSILVW